MLLLFLPQGGGGPTAAGFDLSQTVNTLLSRLGASSWTDIDWLTEAEAYSYFDEAAKRLAQIAGVFVERDASISLLPSVARYNAPDGWISTIHVSAGSTRLRPVSVAELRALDWQWQQTKGAVQRYSMDAGPLGTITVYPLPLSAQHGVALPVIYHRYPAEISETQTLAPISAVIADYFLYFALNRARGKQSDSAMPEMAAHAKQRVSLYEQVLTAYFGEGE
jgi:hypothetical protein